MKEKTILEKLNESKSAIFVILLVILYGGWKYGYKEYKSTQVKDSFSTPIIYQKDKTNGIERFATEIVLSLENNTPLQYRDEARDLFFFISYAKARHTGKSYEQLTLAEKRTLAILVIRYAAEANGNKITLYEIFGLANALKKEKPELWKEYMEIQSLNMTVEDKNRIKISEDIVKNILN